MPDVDQRANSIVTDWRIGELRRGAVATPLKCPYCSRDFTSSASRCADCSERLGRLLPVLFFAARVAAILGIAAAAAWSILWS